jgi:hypothetical protein
VLPGGNGYSSQEPRRVAALLVALFVTNPPTRRLAVALLVGHPNNGFGDIPASSIIVASSGTIYVGNDFGVVAKRVGSTVWSRAAAGLPNVTVADLVNVPEKGVLYAATHGQGVWQLPVD